MSKLIILVASVALASCAQINLREHLLNQKQQQIDLNNFQNERIREHQELTHQQRQSQLDQLNDQRRVQEQMIRDHEQERIDRGRENQYQRHNVHQVFVPHHHQQIPAVIHLQPAVVNIPSSTRHFNVHDDSNYDYKYAVTDMITGDMKTHKEARRGDEVEGQYTMMDSDGYHRTVNYRANDRDGFDAEVRREPAYPALTYAINHQNYNGFSNYQGHHNQHNFNNNFNNNNNNNQEQWNYSQEVHFIPQPISVATTSVTKVDDGHHNQYTTKTTAV